MPPRIVFQRSLIGDRLLARPNGLDDVEILHRPLVALVVLEVIAVAHLIRRRGARDDVDRHPAVRGPIEGVAGLRGEDRAGEAGAEGDAKLDSVRVLGHARGRHPGVEAMGPGGGRGG